MKKIISLLTVFVLLALICVPVVSAVEPEFEYKLRDDGTIAVTGYNGDSKNIVIPSEIDGYTVTVFKTDAFEDNWHIKSIVFPDTIIKLKATVAWSDALEKVVLPKNLKTIPEGMFRSCNNLKSITLPEKLTTIGDDAFRYTDISSITLPDTVTYIGKRAFGNCDLETVNFPKSLRRIGAESFKWTGLTGELVIPDTVRFIGRSAFLGNKFESVNIGKNVKEISPKAFINNYSNKEFKVDENNPYFQAVDGVLFTKDMKKLVHYPDAKIGDSYTVPDEVEEVVGCAFAYSDLEDVTIGSNVKNIANKSFKNCRTLRSITIPEGVTRIGEEVFSNCTALTSIEIPDSIKKIKYQTFDFCSNLTDVKLPANLEVIEEDAFAFCSNITELDIPLTVRQIGEAAFTYTKITKLTIPYFLDSGYKGCMGWMHELKEVNFLNPNPNYRLYFGYSMPDNVERMSFGDVKVNLTVGGTDEIDSKVFAFYDEDGGMGMTVEGNDVVEAELVDDSYVTIKGLKSGTAKITLNRGIAEQTYIITVE